MSLMTPRPSTSCSNIAKSRRAPCTVQYSASLFEFHLDSVLFESCCCLSAYPETPRPLDSAVNGIGARLDRLGPVILNLDGSMSRITNWDNMSPNEQATALRLVAKRNEERRKQLNEQAQVAGSKQ